MIRLEIYKPSLGKCAPRIRGDDPASYQGCYNAQTCSPHPRG